MLTSDPSNASNLTSGSISAARMPTGSVIQVVQTSIAGPAVFTSSTTFSDTGLTVTITPQFSNSKILVNASVNGLYATVSTVSVNTRLVRNSTALGIIDAVAGYNSTADIGAGGASITYLDSPATTSATTYKVQFASSSAGKQVYVNGSAGNQSASYITVMEIKG